MPVSNAARQAVIAMSREGDIHDMPAPTDYQPLFPGQVKPGHIKVELDFIPVEERLPEYGKEVYLKKFKQGHIVIRVGYWDDDEREDPSWWMTDEGEYLERDAFTHWAEIPEIKGA